MSDKNRWSIVGRRYDDVMEVVEYEPPYRSPLTIEKQTNRLTGFVAFVVLRDGEKLAARQTMGECKRLAERYMYEEPAAKLLETGVSV